MSLQKKQSMDKEMFRTIISENQEYIGSIPLVERPLDLEEHGNYVFVGVRQTGKSYLLYQRGENGAFPPTRDGCIHSLSMRKRG